MSSTKGLYDDPRFLEKVKDEFASRYPDARRAIKNRRDPQYLHAACLWRGFKEGVEYGYHLDRDEGWGNVER